MLTAPAKNTQVGFRSINDDPGRSHMNAVARSLSGIARSIRLLILPDLPAKGDVSNWLSAGGTADVLIRLAATV
jgi:hypothetical protein